MQMFSKSILCIHFYCIQMGEIDPPPSSIRDQSSHCQTSSMTNDGVRRFSTNLVAYTGNVFPNFGLINLILNSSIPRFVIFFGSELNNCGAWT